jgi:Male sterility protein
MSKAIAEDLVYSYRDKLAISIVRPSAIGCSYMEPEAGFVQGFQVSLHLFKFAFAYIFQF